MLKEQANKSTSHLDKSRSLRYRVDESLVSKSETMSRQAAQQAEPAHVPQWLTRLHMLFYVIAEHEMNIELVRSELCENDEFSPRGLFKYMQMGRATDGKIGANELKEFMYRDDEMDPETLELVVKEVVKEFDCDFDGVLSY